MLGVGEKFPFCFGNFLCGMSGVALNCVSGEKRAHCVAAMWVTQARGRRRRAAAAPPPPRAELPP